MEIVIVVGLVAAAVGLGLGYLIKALLDRMHVREAAAVTAEAHREADSIVKEAKIAAKDELLKSREDFEKSTRERRQELQQLEQRLASKETNIDRKSDLLEKRLEEMDRRENRLRELEETNRADAEKLKSSQDLIRNELERVSTLSREQARKELLEHLTHELEAERAVLVRRFHEDNQKRFLQEAQEIMINAMQRYASDCTYERTTATIPLPNDEMKGRIIGREGRNIRALEAATGVSVLIDDTPEAVVISCFDPVRRQIGRIAMERLVEDGRIHPSRIEDIVNKVKAEIDNEIMQAGQDAIEEMGITGVRPNQVKLIGRLKFRYSYSQNVLKHSMEVAYLMGTIAAQLGLDEQLARRAGLFHDIGKAVDHEVEGSHAVIGADILKRAGECDEVINAVEAHHEDTEGTSLLAILVNICDTISASRPGARSETTELFLKRLEQLEDIGTSFEGVELCYAIQAGRELRVIVTPGKIDENKAALLARDIAVRIEKEMRYPGQIKVTVIRETRSMEYAK